MGCPARRVSPSQAKIFSTRPPLRGPTCTSSTSIVPETELLRCPQAEAKSDNANNAAPQTPLLIFLRTNVATKPDFALLCNQLNSAYSCCCLLTLCCDLF